MTNKDGGAEADITVSVLENGDGSSVVKPKFEGEKLIKFKFVVNTLTPKGSPYDGVRSSAIRQSKILSHYLGIQGLREIVLLSVNILEEPVVSLAHCTACASIHFHI